MSLSYHENKNQIHFEDIWIKTLHELMVLKNMVEFEGHNHTRQDSILESISQMIIQYNKVMSKLSVNIEYTRDIIEHTSSMVLDIQSNTEHTINEFNDQEVIVQVRSHPFYIMFMEHTQLFTTYRERLLQTLDLCISSFIRKDSEVDDMTLEQFIAFVKNLIYISHEMRRTFDMFYDKGSYVQTMSNTMSTILEEIRTSLFDPNETTNIVRNNNIKVDFDTTEYTQDMKNKQCCICLESYHENTRDIVVLKCSHDFHLKCISESIKYQQKCPLCRTTHI